MIAALGVSAFAEGVNLSLTQSTAAEQLIFAVPEGETITGDTLQSGAFPTGMAVSRSTSAIIISGTPTIVGNYIATILVTTENVEGNSASYLITVNASVVPASNVVINGEETVPTQTPEVTGVINITKHPTDENVTTGDRAVFIARADGATMIEWKIIPYKGTPISLDDFVKSNPGVTISLTDSNQKLIISNVNTNLTGYSAFAIFKNDSGTEVNSNAAMINVTAATPSPVPTVAPTPTPKPVATPQPTPAPTPRAEVTPTPTDVPVQEATADKDKERDRDDDAIRHSHSGAGAIIATVLVGLLTIAIAVVLVMYVKGKIDLSWLEDWINRRNDKK